MTRALCAIGLAACGGAKAPATITEAVVEPIDATPSDPAIDQLEIIADRACGCTDDGCRAAARDSLRGLDGLTHDSSARVSAAVHRAHECLEPVLADLVAADYPVMEDFRARVCACETTACSHAAMRELNAWRDEGGVLRRLALASRDTLDAFDRLDACADQIEFDAPAWERPMP